MLADRRALAMAAALRSAIEKFVTEARKELRIPKEIAWPAKWTSSSMKPEDIERRRHQLDVFFGMFFGKCLVSFVKLDEVSIT